MLLNNLIFLGAEVLCQSMCQEITIKEIVIYFDLNINETRFARIEDCLESKSLSFITYRSEMQKNWGLLSEKNAFLQNFQCSRARSIGFSSGA